MEQFSNRVEQELIQFKSREERLEKLFPSEDIKDNSILADKIKHYGYLLIKYRETANPDERYLLKRIRIQKHQLEKELYPNKFLQLLRRAFSFLAEEKQHAGLLQRQILANQKKLLNTVSNCGFQIPAEKILLNLEAQKENFIVPVSNYVNEKQRMEHQLSFRKDITGDYRFEGFKAILYNETNEAGLKEHFFKYDDPIFNARQAFHLLAGRALERDGTWLQLDLNDKNAEGNYRIKEFRSDYGFDLKNAIKAMPLKDKNSDRIDALFEALKNGEAQPAAFEVKGREHTFLIQANPQFKAVDVYDEHLKKINLSALRAKKSPAGTRKINAVKNVGKKTKSAVRIL